MFSGTTRRDRRDDGRITPTRVLRGGQAPPRAPGIPVICSHCGDALSVSPEAVQAGTPTRCTACGNTVILEATVFGVSMDHARRMAAPKVCASTHSEFPSE